MTQWTDKASYFAEGFHTAWRKASDTTASVFIWNILHLLDQEDWIQFCLEVVGYSDHMDLKKRCLESEALNQAKPSMNIFRHALGMVEDDEWFSIQQFIGSLT